MVALAFAAGSSVSGSHNALPEAVVPYSHSFAILPIAITSVRDTSSGSCLFVPH